MVRKKPASDLKMKIYNESLSRGKNIYWNKKKWQTLLCQLKKKSKDTQLVGQKNIISPKQLIRIPNHGRD